MSTLSALDTTRWPLVKISEIAEINPKKKTFESAQDEEFNFVPMSAVRENFGGIDVSEQRPFSKVKTGYTQFLEGDVLSAKITPCMENGKIAVVPKLRSPCGYGSTEFYVIRPSEKVLPKWIAYFLSQRSFRIQAKRNMAGAVGQQRVPKAWLAEQLIPVAPIQDQQSIIAKIEELFSDLDAGFTSLERAKANLNLYRASVLKAAVEGKLTEQWRKRNPDVEPASVLLEQILEGRREKWEEEQLAKYEAKGKKPPKGWRDKYKEPTFDITSPFDLPSNWCWVTGSQISELITKGASPKWQGFDYSSEGIPFVRSENVRWGRLTTDTIQRVPVEFNEKQKRSVIKEDDVFLNIVGASIGRAAIATPDVVGGNTNQAVAIIRFVSSGVLPQFLMNYLISPIAQQIINVAKVDVARANLSLTDIRNMLFPLPPIAEQQFIVSEIERQLSICTAKEQGILVSLEKQALLRQSILHSAFSGALVP